MPADDWTIWYIEQMTIPYDEDSKDYKRCLLQTVRIRIARKDPTLKFTERYIVTFPDAAHHKNHPVGKVREFIFSWIIDIECVINIVMLKW